MRSGVHRCRPPTTCAALSQLEFEHDGLEISTDHVHGSLERIDSVFYYVDDTSMGTTVDNDTMSAGNGNVIDGILTLRI
jgi:hypothetical protein